MNHCNDCKYWNDGGRKYALGSCHAPGMKKGYGWSLDEIPDNGALVEDNEGWGILTGPEFGCVLYEYNQARDDLAKMMGLK